MSQIRIAGLAHECGLSLGKLQGPILRRRLAAMRRRAHDQGSERVLAERARAFRDRIAAVAPQWLEELQGLAAGAEVLAADILALNCLPPGFDDTPSTVNNCTTFVSLGEQHNELFKIRDTREAAQSYHVQAVTGRRPLHIGRAIGGLGAGHAISATGLAGACNTGSHTDRVDDAPRLDDCHVLRLLLECVDGVDAIPDAYADLVAADAVGGAGPGRGALYLFVDARRGLLLEAAGSDFEATFFDEGTHVISNHFLSPRTERWWSRPPELNTLRRRERLQDLLRRAREPQPSPGTVFAASRDRKHHPHSLCNDDAVHFWMTVSAQLQVVNREDVAASTNWVCCGNTRQSVYVPVPLSAETSFLPWVDGAFYGATERRYRQHRCRPSLGASQRRFEARALAQGAVAWQRLCAEAYDVVCAEAIAGA